MSIRVFNIGAGTGLISEEVARLDVVKEVSKRYAQLPV
jgi:hypothetical protein